MKHISLKNLKFTLGTLTCATALFALQNASADTLVDFNTPGDLTTNFNNNGPITSVVSETTSSGLNDSSAVTLNSGNGFSTTLIYNGFSINATNGQTATQSVYFQWTTPENFNNQPLFLGYTADAEDTFSSPSPNGDSWFGAGITVNGAGLVQLITRSYSSSTNTNTTNSFQGPNQTLVSGSWYYLESTATTSDGATWLLSTTLHEATSTGVVGSTILSQENISLTSAFSGDSSIFAGMQLKTWEDTSGALGINIIDNYSLIPEPVSYSLLTAIGVMGMLPIIRRRTAKRA